MAAADPAGSDPRSRRDLCVDRLAELAAEEIALELPGTPAAPSSGVTPAILWGLLRTRLAPPCPPRSGPAAAAAAARAEAAAELDGPTRAAVWRALCTRHAAELRFWRVNASASSWEQLTAEQLSTLTLAVAEREDVRVRGTPALIALVTGLELTDVTLCQNDPSRREFVRMMQNIAHARSSGITQVELAHRIGTGTKRLSKLLDVVERKGVTCKEWVRDENGSTTRRIWLCRVLDRGTVWPAVHQSGGALDGLTAAASQARLKMEAKDYAALLVVHWLDSAQEPIALRAVKRRLAQRFLRRDRWPQGKEYQHFLNRTLEKALRHHTAWRLRSPGKSGAVYLTRDDMFPVFFGPKGRWAPARESGRKRGRAAAAEAAEGPPPPPPEPLPAQPAEPAVVTGVLSGAAGVRFGRLPVHHTMLRSVAERTPLGLPRHASRLLLGDEKLRERVDAYLGDTPVVQRMHIKIRRVTNHIWHLPSGALVEMEQRAAKPGAPLAYYPCNDGQIYPDLTRQRTADVEQLTGRCSARQVAAASALLDAPAKHDPPASAASPRPKRSKKTEDPCKPKPYASWWPGFGKGTPPLQVPEPESQRPAPAPAPGPDVADSVRLSHWGRVHWQAANDCAPAEGDEAAAGAAQMLLDDDAGVEQQAGASSNPRVGIREFFARRVASVLRKQGVLCRTELRSRQHEVGVAATRSLVDAVFRLMCDTGRARLVTKSLVMDEEEDVYADQLPQGSEGSDEDGGAQPVPCIELLLDPSVDPDGELVKAYLTKKRSWLWRRCIISRVASARRRPAGAPSPPAATG
eukprot:TRINITY_DN15744_c0_g1_i1.p1 TRINITY_DN15744_c0_g1~~TRINITY_DN15744_c0_g1_i1.p1  ORF type:complete len:826 (+),score=208.00 TRINITY_DN15744_c0_g1_i1:70-2478(+)